jgi:hypothetical protein
VVFVERFCVDEFFNSRFLLSARRRARNITRIHKHGCKVVVCTEAKRGDEKEVEEEVARKGSCGVLAAARREYGCDCLTRKNVSDVSDSYPRKSCCENSGQEWLFDECQ